MPPLPVISGREAVRIFELAGWKVDRKVGSHLMMTKAGERATLSVPEHDDGCWHPSEIHPPIRANAGGVRQVERLRTSSGSRFPYGE